MIRRRVLGWLLTLGISAGARASAQAPADRPSLQAWRDTLRTTQDTAALRATASALTDSLHHRRGGALLQLRLGFAQLRQGELQQTDAGFSDAEATFSDVLTGHPDWPLALVGRGLARVNLAQTESALSRGLRVLGSSDKAVDAAHDLANSAIADSTCLSGLIEVSNIAAADHHGPHVRAAVLALRGVTGHPAADAPAVQLARARAELNARNIDSALAVARRLLAIAPDNAGALMVLGHAQMTLGDVHGADAWFRGLALADPSLLQVYRNDLQLVFPDSARRAFDSLTGVARAQYVRQFFELDDPQKIRTADERIREHYRRLDSARVLFALPGHDYLADAATRYDPDRQGLDERGLVWLLHGEPDQRTHIAAAALPPNESWHYARPEGGEFLFHFVETDRVHGFRRVPSLLDILALSTPARMSGQTDMRERTARGEAIETYGAGWTALTAEELLSSRSGISPTYKHMYSSGKDSTAALQAAERAVGDSSMAHGETWALRYELPLQGWVEAVAVGADAQGTLLQIPFAISGASLYAPSSVGAVVYPVRLRVSVIGPSGLVARIDTVRNFVARAPVPADGLLLGSLPVHVPPGDYTVHIALETSDRGMVAPTDTVEVAALNRGALRLSDIALGLRREARWISPRGDSVWLNPQREFSAREPMELYFEVGPLKPGAPYHIDVAVLRAGDLRQQLQVGFDARATALVDHVRRSVDVSRLHPGAYQIQVTVVTPAGDRTTRRQEFTVIR